jgi:type I restriction enzyme S subunit
MRIRTDENRLLPEFLHAFLAAPQGRALFLNHTRLSAVQVNINTGEFCSIPLPVPPIDLQKAFIQQVDRVRGVREDVAHSNEQLHKLGSSIGAVAFSGELTKQWRAKRSQQLGAEASERDVILKTSGVALANAIVIKDTVTAEIDRRRRDFTREQGQLLKSIQTSWKPDDPETWVFTHETLAESLDSSLSGNADAIRRHLEVFAARGLIIPISREVELSDGSTEWRVAYRRPHEKTDDGPPEDAIRLQELANLAKQIKELQK